MGAMRTGVLVLFGLLVPVASTETLFTDPVICYFLDSILVVYCLVATALFFREKFIYPRYVEGSGDNAIYQELQRTEDIDTYQEIQQSKGKKKKKKKAQSAQAESAMPEGAAAPPLSPH
uniref:T-cell surface glycoprotein CD3 zeta chain n=1 Tax=Gasterosteus aculeatus aculeatus TaxID=481459 RepID=A0AAQ4Q008_GASAC|nr:CD247 antigen like isoform X1 [Gasterosteus aculeatus aculeatus]